MKNNILLFSALSILVSCTKNNTPENKTPDTNAINRSFVWQRNYYVTRGAPGDTSYAKPDTIIPIHVIDNNTISFSGNTFVRTTYAYTNIYDKNMTPDSIYLHFVDTTYLGLHATRYLNYFFQKDSVCFIDENGGLGGHIQSIYTSKL